MICHLTHGQLFWIVFWSFLAGAIFGAAGMFGAFVWSEVRAEKRRLKVIAAEDDGR